MRIVSLLPSITEIVCALGMESHLVGRSHECDYPASVQSLPACTAPKYKADGTSYKIDQRIKAMVQEGLSVYRVDAELIASLDPDLILTQDHCEVCAASYEEVQRAVKQQLGDKVKVLSFSPDTLDDVLMSIYDIAEVLEADEAGAELINNIVNRLNKIQSKTENLPTPGVICIEWIEPLMSAGNWFPELVNIAGGKTLLGDAGGPSPWIDWEVVIAKDPDILLISPCGYSLEKTTGEMTSLTSNSGWDNLQAVQNSRVYLMEGDHYFHRPGPRLVESTEILAEIFHPGIFDFGHRKRGWIKFTGL